MRPILPPSAKHIKVIYPKNTGGAIPIIYIRSWQGTVVYVGETINYYGGRHLRPRCLDVPHHTLEEIEMMDQKFFKMYPGKKEWWKHVIMWDNTDTIRILNAPQNDQARRRWEAKLVCWLNPKLQKVKKYIRHANLDIKSKRDHEIITRVNGDMLLGRVATHAQNILRSIKECKKDLKGTGRYGNHPYTSINRVFKEINRFSSYKNDFLSTNSVLPTIKEEVNQITDQMREKANKMKLVK